MKTRSRMEKALRGIGGAVLMAALLYAALAGRPGPVVRRGQHGTSTATGGTAVSGVSPDFAAYEATEAAFWGRYRELLPANH